MGKFIDLTGQKFGRLTVMKRVENAKGGKTQWLCECKCGNSPKIRSSDLKSGKTKSCGCLQSELMKQTKLKHNLANTRIHNIWKTMKGRCYRKNSTKYYCYGARGIVVCDEWRNLENGFINFYDWSMKNGYTDKLSIDRIDVNGNYEPSNCRWVDGITQANNKTNNVCVVIEDEKHTITEWSRIKKMSINTIRDRLRKGWSPEDAIMIKSKKMQRKDITKNE